MNCKQGDLAIIVKAVNPENIGKIVEVVRPYVQGERLLSINGKRGGRVVGSMFSNDIWVVRSRGTPLVWSNHNDKIINALFSERAFSDRGLRPIPKLDEPEQTTTDEPTGELA